MENHVAIVIRNEHNHILFIKRSLNKKTLPGAWSFPSGTVEKEEKIYDTAIREAQEELGITVSPERVFAKLNLEEFNVHLLFVLCMLKEGNPVIQARDEIDSFQWMSFPEFFHTFSDDYIGHGLDWMRKNKRVCEDLE